MNFAKCLHCNSSVKGINRADSEFVLPVNDRLPIYRRQVGSIFSVEYSGEQRFGHDDRRGGNRRPALSYLF